jgi:hypothetical protein
MSIASRFSRVAAVGALAVAMACGSAMVAQAATEPTPPTDSQGTFYLFDPDAGAPVAAGTQLAFGHDVIAIAQPTFTDPELTNRILGPTGSDSATAARVFISARGHERDGGFPLAYSPVALAFGAEAMPGKTSILEPDMTPDFLVNGDKASIKSNGGNYSLGIQWTSNNGLTVLAATYAYITVDAGGAYKFSTYVPPVVATEVVTTTTLAALPTTVEAGQSTVLTATVTASKAVTGNVQFFEGNTSLGTSAISAGTASKTVTVGSAGAHAYHATFVENTVGTDKFLTSSSADVTVTASVPAVALPPNAPTENSLNVSTANGATAGYDAVTHTASLNNVPAINNGKSVNVFGYSTPTFFGAQTVTGGTVTVNVSTLAIGDHKLAIADPTTGDVIAWASFTKSDAATSPEIVKTINADVAGQTLADGEFSLTNLSGATVNLTNPALVNGASVVSGTLGSFKVTDLRQVSKPGWRLSTYVTDFAKGTDTIAASALGIDPKIVSQAGTGATAPTLGAAMTSGSASYPWNFATLAGTSFSGVSTYNADLVFTAPQGKPAGTYTSTLTLTLISN